MLGNKKAKTIFLQVNDAVSIVGVLSWNILSRDICLYFTARLAMTISIRKYSLPINDFIKALLSIVYLQVLKTSNFEKRTKQWYARNLHITVM